MANGGMKPGLIETPSEALGPTVLETVTLAGRTYYLERPDAVDRLSDHPELGGASATDEYKPYWASLWPAARLLAWAVLRGNRESHRALEIGCGLGLPGIAGLALGLHVTFSDYDAAALRYAAGNARLNGFTNFDTLHMDWREPPPGLRIPLLLASEPIYVLDLVESLADFIAGALEPAGLFLMTDQGRLQAEALRGALLARNMECFARQINTDETGAEGVAGVLTWACHRRDERGRRVG
jgi:SAM-dependent methyltransferase